MRLYILKNNFINFQRYLKSILKYIKLINKLPDEHDNQSRPGDHSKTHRKTKRLKRNQSFHSQASSFNNSNDYEGIESEIDEEVVPITMTQCMIDNSEPNLGIDIDLLLQNWAAFPDTASLGLQDYCNSLTVKLCNSWLAKLNTRSNTVASSVMVDPQKS